MKPQTLNPPFTTVFKSELNQIADFYKLSFLPIEKAIKPLMANFKEYWEMVFCKNGFELITAGKGKQLVADIKQIALEQGLSKETTDLFEKCTAKFPEVIFGIKLVFCKHGDAKPTLYVRTKTDMQEGLHFLSGYVSLTDLRLIETALEGSKTLYGLGFSEKEGVSYIKTYTINPVKNAAGNEIMGFVSHRLHQNQVNYEHKTYLPEVSLLEFETSDQDLHSLLQFLVYEMNYTTAGHIGELHREGEQKETKIYVERIGGIPTDFSAR